MCTHHCFLLFLQDTPYKKLKTVFSSSPLIPFFSLSLWSHVNNRVRVESFRIVTHHRFRSRAACQKSSSLLVGIARLCGNCNAAATRQQRGGNAAATRRHRGGNAAASQSVATLWQRCGNAAAMLSVATLCQRGGHAVCGNAVASLCQR